MHDLGRILRDLQESLSLDKHPVALLIGAGCPLSVRENVSGAIRPIIPDIRGLTDLVRAKLAADAAFLTVEEHFKEDGRPDPNFEDMLSHVRLLRRVVGNGAARGLASAQLDGLEEQLCDVVSEAVRKDLPGRDTPYHRMAARLGWRYPPP